MKALQYEEGNTLNDTQKQIIADYFDCGVGQTLSAILIVATLKFEERTATLSAINAMIPFKLHSEEAFDRIVNETYDKHIDSYPEVTREIQENLKFYFRVRNGEMPDKNPLFKDIEKLGNTSHAEVKALIGTMLGEYLRQWMLINDKEKETSGIAPRNFLKPIGARNYFADDDLPANDTAPNRNTTSLDELTPQERFASARKFWNNPGNDDVYQGR